MAIVEPLEDRILLSATTAIDEVYFGNTASETAHSLVATAAPVGTGGLGQTERQITPTSTSGVNNTLTFTLTCSPTAQNYITIKLWGSDEESGLIYLFNGTTQIETYATNDPELDVQNGNITAPAYPDRFYYATGFIPLSMTSGKSSVTLTLNAIESYNYYSNAATPLDAPTRGIYAAYTSTNSAFVPPASEVQGTEPPVVAPTPATPNFSTMQSQLDSDVTTLEGWQIYGSSWNAAVTAGTVPYQIIGAIYPGAKVTNSYTLTQWLNNTETTETASNAVDMEALEDFAEAYNNSSSTYYHSTDLLNRIVECLDSMYQMQGSNGAFTSATWAGASSTGRTAATGNESLEGFGTNAIGQAFVLMENNSAFQSDLSQNIENELTSSTMPAQVTRSAGYTSMFVALRNFLVTPVARGHAPNQDMEQETAMWLANQSLHYLSPSQAWTNAQALPYIYTAIGNATLGPSTENQYQGYWFTPAGLAMEDTGTGAGGYDGSYGENDVTEIVRLAQITGDPTVTTWALNAIHAFDNFYYPADNIVGSTDYAAIRKEEVISYRKNYNVGEIDYDAQYYAAAVLDDPESIRSVQLQEQQGVLPTASIPASSNAHFVDDVFQVLSTYSYYKTSVALPATSARLPMEAGQPDYAWVDVQGGIVAIKNQGSIIYMSLNWRRGWGGNGTRDQADERVDNIARIDDMEPDTELIATVGMSSPDGFGQLYYIQFGDYLVGMDLSSTNSYQLPVPAGGGMAVDLISGKTYNLASDPTLSPGQALVLYLAPFAPTNLTASAASATSASLTWNDNSTNETGFVIERATNSTFTQNVVQISVPANATSTDSYTDTSLTPGTTYYYQVWAVNNTDNSNPTNTASVLLPQEVGAVANEYLFYFGSSAFDNGATSPGSADQNAIATDKSALVSSSSAATATFSNVSNYTGGITGILIDIAGVSGVSFSAGDFAFKVGNTSNSSSWSSGPAPSAVATWTGNDGDSFADIVWPNNTIEDEWLQVTVLADANTHLANNVEFYFGNEIAATGASINNGVLQVNTTDVSETQQNETGFSSAPITDVYDFNRDGSVNTTDVSIVQQNETGFGGLLLITVGGSTGNVVIDGSNSPATAAVAAQPMTSSGSTAYNSSSATSSLLKQDQDPLHRAAPHHAR